MIATYFRDNGAETVDFTIVASGPNSAFPHHEIGDRRLQTGDTIILDIGATLAGYRSDITRVVQLGEPSAEVKAVYQAVLEANQRGRAAAVAGAKAREVDRAARSAIEEAGYGPLFPHRTGHGLGLEVHEPPWITAEPVKLYWSRAWSFRSSQGFTYRISLASASKILWWSQRGRVAV